MHMYRYYIPMPCFGQKTFGGEVWFVPSRPAASKRQRNSSLDNWGIPIYHYQ